MQQPDASHSRTHTERVEDPEALAKHAIKLLEKRLAEEYGVKVQMGVELEYSLFMKPDAPGLMNSPSAITDDPLRLGTYGDQRLFRLSRFVAYGYREGAGYSDATKSICRYEMVTDHTHPIPLHLLPRSIDMLRKELASGGNRMMKADGTLNDPPITTKITKWNITHPRRIRQAKWYNANVTDVRFDSQEEGKITNGLHLNFSLVDLKTGNAILKSMDPLMTALVDTTNRYFTEQERLFKETPEQSFRADIRGKKKAYPHVAIRSTDMEQKSPLTEQGMPCYLENKTPPADCNTYYAVLTQLAAICDAVAQSHGQPASNLKEVMNSLEPALGDRFKKAERAHPELKSVHSGNEIAAQQSR